MERFDSPFGPVELTAERDHHIFDFHPEIRRYRKNFVKTLTDPQFIRPSKTDPATLILYRRMGNNKYLAIVTKINSQRNFILTAYLTDKLKPQRL